MDVCCFCQVGKDCVEINIPKGSGENDGMAFFFPLKKFFLMKAFERPVENVLNFHLLR